MSNSLTKLCFKYILHKLSGSILFNKKRSQKSLNKVCRKLFYILYEEQMRLQFGNAPAQFSRQCKTVRLLTPATTYPNAVALANALESFGYRTCIESEFTLMEHLDDQHLYFVLTPSYFQKGLPLNYIALNFEQSTYEWWFTKDYIDTLNQGIAVLDYTRANIEYLKKRGIPEDKLHYLPLAANACEEGILEAKTPACIFYGGTKPPRRARMLAELKESCGLKVIENVYGEEMQRILKEASIVVNIHTEADAVLETTRICEAISHGCLVISETCSNYDEFPELTKMVEFVPLGDTKAIAERISYWQAHPEHLKEKLEENRRIAAASCDTYRTTLKEILLRYHILETAD